MGKRFRGKRKGKGKQQTHRKTTTPTVSASASNPNGAQDLPDDVIIYEILPRLPGNSLLSWRSTSKQWHESLNHPDFISDHLNHQPAGALIEARRAPIAVDGEPYPRQPNGHIMYAYSRPNPESGENSSIDRIHPFPGSDSVGHLNVVGITRNGVVCIVQHRLAQNFTLWNPVTQSVLNIPEPDSPNPDALIGASAGFGFDPSNNEYVIIRIVQFRQETNSYPDVAQCFNFQTGRWDWVNNDYHGMLPFWFMNPTCEAVVNDVPYWMVEARSVGFELCLKLAWFDMRTRVFNLELLPDDWLNKFVIMGEIRPGYLGAIVWCSDAVVFDRDLYVWTRNDENGEWSETYRVDIRSKPTGGLLVGFYGDAEIVVELRTDPDRIPFLQMMKIDVVDEIGNSLLEEVDDCYLDGAFFGTCRMMRYRKSLTQMPRIGG